MYGRVLVGTDGSATAARAVSRAVEVARATGSALTILSVGSGEGALACAREAAAAHADSGLDIQAKACEGDPAEALLDVAGADGAGLVVVGSKGMHGARHLLGSVPNTVSHRARVHVLIVHTG